MRIKGDHGICDDFTIAQAVESEEVMQEVRGFFSDRQGRVNVDRQDIEAETNIQSMDDHDARAIFTGLLQNGVAREAEPASTYADYVFTVDSEGAVEVLEQQIAASRAAIGDLRIKDPGVSLIATIPEELPVVHKNIFAGDAYPISSEIQNILLGSEETLRVANPYFSSVERLVSYLKDLPSRGVDVRILTREATSEEGGLDDILAKLVEEAESSPGSLEISDLFEKDEDGNQIYATHAKLMIADRDHCYVGSANLMATSMSHNFEMGVSVQGNLAEQAAEIFDSVYEQAETVASSDDGSMMV